MSEKKIYKKILPKHYEAVYNYQKNFESRKDKDGVGVGDVLILQEWDGVRYTGRELYRIVLYFCVIVLNTDLWMDIAL